MPVTWSCSQVKSHLNGWSVFVLTRSSVYVFCSVFVLSIKRWPSVNAFDSWPRMGRMITIQNNGIWLFQFQFYNPQACAKVGVIHSCNFRWIFRTCLAAFGYSLKVSLKIFICNFANIGILEAERCYFINPIPIRLLNGTMTSLTWNASNVVDVVEERKHIIKLFGSVLHINYSRLPEAARNLAQNAIQHIKDVASTSEEATLCLAQHFLWFSTGCHERSVEETPSRMIRRKRMGPVADLLSKPYIKTKSEEIFVFLKHFECDNFTHSRSRKGRRSLHVWWSH